MPQRSSPTAALNSTGHQPPPPFEVADIVRGYGEALRATHPVSHEQARVLRAIAHCRTAALGGHVEVCAACGTERICYDSCLMVSISLWGVHPERKSGSSRKIRFLRALWSEITLHYRSVPS